MLEDSDRLLATIEQVLRTGRMGASGAQAESGAHRPGCAGGGVRGRARARCTSVPPEALQYHPGAPWPRLADPEEVRAAVSNLIDNAVKYSGRDVHVSRWRPPNVDGKFVLGAGEGYRPRHSQRRS